MKRKTKSNGKTCVCCGVFCRWKFCKQCQFAGCELSRRGDRCRLALGSALAHSLPAVHVSPAFAEPAVGRPATDRESPAMEVSK